MNIIRQIYYYTDICKALSSADKMTGEEIANKIGMSISHVEKTCKLLIKLKVVGSNRGATGGYFMLNSGSNLTIERIVKSLMSKSELSEAEKKIWLYLLQPAFDQKITLGDLL